MASNRRCRLRQGEARDERFENRGGRTSTFQGRLACRLREFDVSEGMSTTCRALSVKRAAEAGSGTVHPVQVVDSTREQNGARPWADLSCDLGF